MGMVCQICNSSQRISMDRELVRGKSYESISRNYGVSAQSLRRHWESGHVTQHMMQVQEAEKLVENKYLLQEIESLIDRTKNLLSWAEEAAKNKKAANLNTAFKGIDSLRGHYELLSKIAISLQQTKLQEAELEIYRSETQKEEQGRKTASLAADRLTQPEFQLLERLIAKIEGQTGEVIEAGPKFRKPKNTQPKGRVVLPEEPEEEEGEEVGFEETEETAEEEESGEAVKPVFGKTIPGAQGRYEISVQRKKIFK